MEIETSKMVIIDANGDDLTFEKVTEVVTDDPNYLILVREGKELVALKHDHVVQFFLVKDIPIRLVS